MGNLSLEAIQSQKKEFEFVITSVPEIDAFFQKVTDMFNEFEGHHLKIQKALIKSAELAGINYLEDPNMVLPFYAMIWSMASCCKGNLKDILYFSTASRVQLKFNKTKSVRDDVWKLYEAVDDLMDIYHTTVEESTKMNDRMEKLLLELSELKKNAFIKKYTSKEHVSRWEFDNMVEKNENTYLKMSNALYYWNNLHLTMGKEYRKVLQSLDKFIEEANEIGNKAIKEQIYEPKAIYKTFKSK